MKKEEQLVKKEDLNPDNIIKMFPEAKLLTAGKGPTDKDWLSELDTGCEFLISVKPEAPTTKIFLQEYLLSDKSDFAVKLKDTNNQFTWVNPKEFCKMFDLYEILNAPEESA